MSYSKSDNTSCAHQVQSAHHIKLDIKKGFRIIILPLLDKTAQETT